MKRTLLVLIASVICCSVAQEEGGDEKESTQFTDGQIALLVFMPFVSGFVGWITNVIALQMTFYPLEFVGFYVCKIQSFPFFGWQGIIPGKAPKMAHISIDLITKHLIQMDEVYARIDPDRLAHEVVPMMRDTLETTIGDVAMNRAGTVWSILPAHIKEEMITMCQEEAPEMVANMFQEVRDNILDLFDVKYMVIEQLNRDKMLLNTIFLVCGDKEFRFIRLSGGVFGFLFGLVQLIVYLNYQALWVLPFFGFIVGYATNFLALKIIFKPINPHKIGCCTCQGLFLKRKEEVSVIYADIISREVLTAENMMVSLLTGPRCGAVEQIFRKHAEASLNKSAGSSAAAMVLALGAEGYQDVKKEIADNMWRDIVPVMMGGVQYCDDAMKLRDTLEYKMKNLEDKDFEGMLHPVFEEDELTLIVVGALLGMLVGFAQAALQAAADSAA